MEPLSTILQEARSGTPESREALINSLYDRLHSFAAALLRNERAGHTLQPTALVNEAWIRLSASDNLDQASKTTFFAAAATTFRRILIEHARGRNAQKRGGGAMRMELTDVESPSPPTEVDIGALDSALQSFAAQFPRQHQVVEMKYFANLTVKQIAEVLGVSERTVANDWDFARVWLRTHLGTPN